MPEIQKGVNQHEQRIDALEKSQALQDKEIEDTKSSISELGDEVNSVAGRVTNLETSQTTQNREIDALKGKDSAQDGRLDALETSEVAQDADILQLKEDVKSAGKVDDVQVDGSSVVENKVAKIPKVYSEDEIKEIVNALISAGYVPYSGATNSLNLGGQQFRTQGNAYLSGDSYINDATFGNGSGSGKQFTVARGSAIGAGCDLIGGGCGLVAALDTTSGSTSGYGRLKLARGDTDHTNLFLYALSEPEEDHNGLVLYPRIEYIIPGTVSEVGQYMGRFRTNTPVNDFDAANKAYVDTHTCKCKTFKLALSSEAVAAGESKTFITSLSPIPVTPGHVLNIISILISDDDPASETMSYNYGLAYNDYGIFATYFNNSNAEKTPTGKTAIIQYTIEEGN